MSQRFGGWLAAVSAGVLVLSFCGAGPIADETSGAAESTISIDTPTAIASDEVAPRSDGSAEPTTTAEPASTPPDVSVTTTESAAPEPAEAYDEQDEEVVVIPSDLVLDPGNGIAMAKGDLAERLGIDESAIAVVSVEDVVWRDTSLDCPERGHTYAQVLTPGSRIVLSAAAESYEYHSGLGKILAFCGKV